MVAGRQRRLQQLAAKDFVMSSDVTLHCHCRRIGGVHWLAVDNDHALRNAP